MYLSIISRAIEINTSLLFGLSLTDVELSKVLKKSIVLSLILGLAYYFVKVMIKSEFAIAIIYLLMIPVVFLIIKLPFSQVLVSTLLALAFNLSMIQILQNNLLDILLMKSNIVDDVVIESSMEIFKGLNNIVALLIIYNSSIVLFPRIIFSRRLKLDKLVGLQDTDIYSTLFILIILNFGLAMISFELPYFRYNFRLLLILWSLMFSSSLLFYQSRSIKYKRELTDFLFDRQHQEDILSYYSVVRSQRHDFNFHLNTLYNLTNNENYDACKEYIKDLVQEARYINDLLLMYHPAIGAMLNTFKEIAAQKNAQINYYIMDDLKRMSCSVYEMNKILGNLIQNAIDEVEDKDNPIIDVETSNERGATIIIKVTNDTNMMEEELEKIFDLNYSTKDMHEGIGLSTIRNILLKYNGTIYTELENGKISFIVRLPISSA